MQFVRGGPDIDERLLQAHEDGQVVFFCGAGISYPAHLPGFKGLTEGLFDRFGPGTEIENAALKAGTYDMAIGLLESRLPGGRPALRREMAGILTPNLTLPGATRTHESLLQLGMARDGRCRLITTNFDRLFEPERQRLNVGSYQAPLLPIPKHRWEGLVYLHGLLTEAPTDAELNSLVLSSGDFGLAYLNERWAARFVSELFRTYTVCFVGYSLNDPVLRYMMDALAADRLLGEKPIQAFAFCSYARGQYDRAENEWKAKNVTPILYANHYHHAYLHRTLHAWAQTYRDGVRGKIAIVTKYGIARPTGSTVEDNYVGRMQWALSDSSGDPAKHFGELDPPPSLDWLEPLSELRFGHHDLPRFGIQPKPKSDAGLSFSLISRPMPYDRGPWMSLVAAGGVTANQWDDVMARLAVWLVKHIAAPKLLHWALAGRGPTGAFKAQLEWRMRSDPPAGAIGVLWQLVLDGRAQYGGYSGDLYAWLKEFKANGLTPSLRWRLMRLLRPMASLAEPIGIDDRGARDPAEPFKVRELVHWDIVLASDSVHYFLREETGSDAWKASLAELLSDFTHLLLEAIRLMQALEGADRHHDYSYLHQPSIGAHPQNNDFRDWTALINLTRDAWRASVEREPQKAAAEAVRWSLIDFPLFRRLVFYAGATAPQLFSRSWLFDRLLDDGGWWLWSVEVRREAMQLLAVQVPHLSPEELDRLQQLILAGPPAGMYRDDAEPELIRSVTDNETFRLLNKIRNMGRELTGSALDLWREIGQAHPDWQRDDDEQQEFPVWSSGVTGWQVNNISPRLRRDLEAWLMQPVEDNFFARDDWDEQCRNQFSRALTALLALARRNEWNIPRWRTALDVWWQGKYLRRSWQFLAEPLSNAPDAVFEGLRPQISHWVRENGKVFEGHDAAFFRIVERIVGAYGAGLIGATDDYIASAINHPVGHATDALLGWWYRQNPTDGQGLPAEVEPFLTRLTDSAIEAYRNGRVILHMNLLALFRVDRPWTERQLLRFYDWVPWPTEACIAWTAFLWSPRLYEPLFAAFKTDFLATARHYDALQKSDRQYASLLTYAALELPETFTRAELAAATLALPRKGLEQASQALYQALQGAGDRRSDYWTNRIQSYLKRVWPKMLDIRTAKIAENFAILCIAAGDRFPEALSETSAWLMPLARPEFVVHTLLEAGLSSRFPAEALQLLDILVRDEAEWVPSKLKSCLVAIAAARADLADTPMFQRLKLLAERFQ